MDGLACLNDIKFSCSNTQDNASREPSRNQIGTSQERLTADAVKLTNASMAI